MYKFICTLAILIAATPGCSTRSEFEEFSYQGCIKEGKYHEKICSCNARNLERALTNEEKSIYKKAALGDTSAGINLFRMIDKLTKALQDCAQ
jgi:hypothetical protein